MNGGTSKREKLSCNVSDSYPVLTTDGTTVTIQLGDVTEKVARSRWIPAPFSLTLTPRINDATPTDLHARTKDRNEWLFRLFVDHRERGEGTSEFRVD